jgi:maleate isomerase
LRNSGVERLAIASPYPAWIVEACTEFWTGKGFDVVAATTAAARMTDTRDIYSLDPEQACARFVEDLSREAGAVTADVLLVTGTGLPTLPLLAPLGEALGLPVLSSNGCLAHACLRAARC